MSGDRQTAAITERLVEHLESAEFHHKAWSDDAGRHFVRIQSQHDAQHDTYYTGVGDSYEDALAAACEWVTEWIIEDDGPPVGNGSTGEAS